MSKKYIYLLQYKKGEKIDILTGVINEIKKKDKLYSLLHNCDTDKDSHGGTIILYNHKVIGINRNLDS